MKKKKLKMIFDSLPVQLIQATIEISIHVYLLLSLKSPGEPISASHGSALSKALLIIRDRVYNYNFGRHSYIIKFVFSLHYIPSVIRLWQQLHTFESMIKFMMIIFEATCLIDLVNTTQSILCFNLLLLIKFIRMVYINWEFLQFFVRCYKQKTKIIPKQEAPVLITQSISRPPKPLITKTQKKIISNQLIKKDQQIKKPAIAAAKLIIPTEIIEESLDATRPTLVTTKPLLKTNKKNLTQSNETSEKKSTQSVETNEKKSNSTEKQIQKKAKKLIWPSFQFRIKTNGYIIVKVNDPFQFDQAFANIFQLSKQDLLHVKIHYCHEILRFFRRNVDKQALNHLHKILSQYMAELILT